jgi:2-polyprenyl-3-methyl-5-hydroxy-6-metoxy-1,4-benzoquinol methylase
MKDIPLMEWTPERIKRFWDWQSRFPEDYFTVLFGPHIVSHFKSMLAGKSVLDLGCGPGGLLPHLCSVATTVSGADLSEASVAAANARGDGFPASPVRILLRISRRIWRPSTSYCPSR